MISVGFKPAKAEIQVSTPDNAFQGQHRAGFRDVPGESDQQHWRCGSCAQHRWAQGFPKCSLFQSLAPISSGEPWHPRKAYIMVPTTFSSNYLCISSLIGCGFYRAKTKLGSSLKVSRGLTSCLMNEYLKQKYLVQHRSDQQLQGPGLCDLCIRSVEKRLWRGW